MVLIEMNCKGTVDSIMQDEGLQNFAGELNSAAVVGYRRYLAHTAIVVQQVIIL